MASNILRNLPSVNDLIESPPLRGLRQRVSHNVVVDGVRAFLDQLREDVRERAGEIKVPEPQDLAEMIARWIAHEDLPKLRPVINATGVLLHTGLGRAPLAQEALDAIVDVSRGYASVEVDLQSGERSQRIQAVESLLRQITGAEAAAVVNNNAGATLLTLAAMATGKEVIVSRGELIEIGGSYRLPDVMSTSGAILKEVGTTNKTRRSDYESAIGEQTAALMRVHTSNYVVAGFSESTSLADLVSLGREHNLPVIDDIGSGALIDFSPFGLKDEPVAGDSVAAGADVVLFSGDKLIGGPQCGIAVGKKKWIDKIIRHPLMRALRVDKTTLAALMATLRLYRTPDAARQSIPLLALLDTPLDNLKNRAERLAPQMASTSQIETATPVEDETFLGGGSVPTQRIQTWCIALSPKEMSVDQLAQKLRAGMPAVMGRIQNDRLLLDMRTVFPREDRALVECVEAVSDSPKNEPRAADSLTAPSFPPSD